MSAPSGEPPTDPIADLLDRRREVRRFDPGRDLPDAVVARLIERAGRAPSDFHLQPWRFVVVRQPRNRRRLRRCCYGDARLTDAPVALIVLGYRRGHRTDIDAATAALVACGACPPADAARLRATASRLAGLGGELVPEAWAAGQANRAATVLALAAGAVGVSTAWVERLDPEQVRAEFGVPDDHTVVGVLALGYAAEQAPDPGRFPLDHLTSAEHFAQPWTPGQVAPSPMDPARPRG